MNYKHKYVNIINMIKNSNDALKMFVDINLGALQTRFVVMMQVLNASV